jgi:hypothetical protein
LCRPRGLFAAFCVCETSVKIKLFNRAASLVPAPDPLPGKAASGLAKPLLSGWAESALARCRPSPSDAQSPAPHAPASAADMSVVRAEVDARFKRHFKPPDPVLQDLENRLSRLNGGRPRASLAAREADLQARLARLGEGMASSQGTVEQRQRSIEARWAALRDAQPKSSG